jgi:hypothetical protein
MNHPSIQRRIKFAQQEKLVYTHITVFGMDIEDDVGHRDGGQR